MTTVTTWFTLCSLLLIAVGNTLVVLLLRHFQDALLVWRRELQLVVLASPVIGLLLGLTHVSACTNLVCGGPGTVWSEAVGIALTMGVGLVAMGAVGLSLVRLALVTPIVARGALPAHPELQATADRLARRIGAPHAHVRVRVRCADRPLALAAGIWQPTILLSTWMLEHLDQGELEAVLAHELGHVARRDVVVIWLATMLRDAFIYLPTSREVYRQLHGEKEPACDDLAISVTHRPLGLASALAKVWQQALISEAALVPASPASPASLAAPLPLQLLAAAGEQIEGRITRLLDMPNRPTMPSAPPPAASASRPRPLHPNAAGVVVSLILGTGIVMLLLALMGCGLGGFAGHGITSV